MRQGMLQAIMSVTRVVRLRPNLSVMAPLKGVHRNWQEQTDAGNQPDLAIGQAQSDHVDGDIGRIEVVGDAPERLGQDNAAHVAL